MLPAMTPLVQAPQFTVITLKAFFQSQGDEPMWCLVPQGPRRGCFWRISYIGLSGTLMNAPINSPSPVNGFFIVPLNQIAETLAEGQATTGPFPGINLNKRGTPLPVICQSTPSGANPATAGSGVQIPKFLLNCTLNAGQGIICPEGFTILGAYSCAPGTAAPGPGAGSQCTMSVIAIEVDPSQGAAGIGSIY